MNYDGATLSILVLMILTGAARTFGVSIFYDVGFEDPLFVTILFVLGHALALPVYFLLSTRDVLQDKENPEYEETKEKLRQLSMIRSKHDGRSVELGAIDEDFDDEALEYEAGSAFRDGIDFGYVADEENNQRFSSTDDDDDDEKDQNRNETFVSIDRDTDATEATSRESSSRESFTRGESTRTHIFSNRSEEPEKLDVSEMAVSSTLDSDGMKVTQDSSLDTEGGSPTDFCSSDVTISSFFQQFRRQSVHNPKKLSPNSNDTRSPATLSASSASTGTKSSFARLFGRSSITKSAKDQSRNSFVQARASLVNLGASAARGREAIGRRSTIRMLVTVPLHAEILDDDIGSDEETTTDEDTLMANALAISRRSPPGSRDSVVAPWVVESRLKKELRESSSTGSNRSSYHSNAVGKESQAQLMRGSATGLTERSKAAVKWVHSVPWWVKPFIPSILNLVSTVCRWNALVYLDASIAEFLVSGLELTFSVFAAKFIRKRDIARQRWFGVSIVLLGLAIIGAVDIFIGEKETVEGKSNRTATDSLIGIAFVLGKVILAVLQDLAEELFMQETSFPALLLLGMEGFYAFALAVPLYFAIGPTVGIDPKSSFITVFQSGSTIGFTIGLVMIFLLAGIFQIMSTSVTSSMTRNMWKNFRGLVVMIAGLIVFYATGSQHTDGDEQLGEPWLVPESFLVLDGFAIVMLGLNVYYRQPK